MCGISHLMARNSGSKCMLGNTAVQTCLRGGTGQIKVCLKGPPCNPKGGELKLFLFSTQLHHGSVLSK